MTEPAPSQGEPPVWHVAGVREFGRFTPEEIFEDEDAAKNDIYNEECDGACIVPVVPKSALDAERARAEQAEAACAAFREATTGNHDVPLSLIEGLQSYAATTENAEKAWHEAMVSKLEAALASALGKSTADELRLLREFANNARETLGNSALSEREQLSELRCFLGVCDRQQPPRAERSES